MAENPNEGELKVPCEVYSRIVGYLRPIQSWHQAKRREFEDRVTFSITPTLTEGENDENDRSSS